MITFDYGKEDDPQTHFIGNAKDADHAKQPFFFRSLPVSPSNVTPRNDFRWGGVGWSGVAELTQTHSFAHRKLARDEKDSLFWSPTCSISRKEHILLLLVPRKIELAERKISSCLLILEKFSWVERRRDDADQQKCSAIDTLLLYSHTYRKHRQKNTFEFRKTSEKKCIKILSGIFETSGVIWVFTCVSVRFRRKVMQLHTSLIWLISHWCESKWNFAARLLDTPPHDNSEYAKPTALAYSEARSYRRVFSFVCR